MSQNDDWVAGTRWFQWMTISLSVSAYPSASQHQIQIRKDRYDKKLKKYYVVYEENDEEVSEDEERKEQHDAEVPSLHWNSSFTSNYPFPQPTSAQVAEDNISFQRLGATRVDSDGEDDESDKEKDAKQVNTGLED